VFESQLLGSFCKQIVPLLTEHDDVIETQTKNCMRVQIAHAVPLVCIQSIKIIYKNAREVMYTENICLSAIFRPK